MRGPAAVSDALQRLLDAHPFPAIASTPRWDIVACNRPAHTLFGKVVGQNALSVTFLDPAIRARFPRWEAYARTLIAKFRVEMGRAAAPAEFDALVAELSAASPDFARWWREHDVNSQPVDTKIVRHPDVGDIELDYVALLHVEPDGRTLRVSFDMPLPGPSLARAQKLFGIKRSSAR